MDAVTREDLRDSYLLCRTIGHAWQVGSASDIARAEKGFWNFVLVCDRCQGRRVDVISAGVGGVEARDYKLPKGYRIDETVTRSELRVEWETRRKLQADKLKRKRK